MNRRHFIVGVAAAGVAGAVGLPALEARPKLVPAVVEEQLGWASQWVTIDQLRDMYPPAGSMVELLDDYYRPRLMALLRDGIEPEPGRGHWKLKVLP